MAAETTFLKLQIPAHDEFPGAWDVPINANFETIDDFLTAFRKAIDNQPFGSLAFTIQGTALSLEARLLVGLNADGTLKLSTQPAFAALSQSKVNPTPAPVTPSARLEQTDREIFDARARAPGDRYVQFPSVPGKLDDGLALRAAEFSGAGGGGIPSPIHEYKANTVVIGPPGLVTYPSGSAVSFNGNGTPALINIDGYPFRLRYDVGLDFSAATPGLPIYFFVDRYDYGGVFQYSRFGGPFATSDLRLIQNNTDGAASAGLSTFSAISGLFSATGRKVKAGDILTIAGTPGVGNAGDYVVASVTSDTMLDIVGTFPVTTGGMTWSIYDKLAPNIGWTQTDPPPYAAGRVYVAEAPAATVIAGPALSAQPKVYSKGGVFTGSTGILVAVVGASPVAQLIAVFEHNLGAIPSEVAIYAENPAAIPNVKYLNPTARSPLGPFLPSPTFMLVTTRMRVDVYAVDYDSIERRMFTDSLGVDIKESANPGTILTLFARR